jgi:hypothetical protein
METGYQRKENAPLPITPIPTADEEAPAISYLLADDELARDEMSVNALDLDLVEILILEMSVDPTFCLAFAAAFPDTAATLRSADVTSWPEYEESLAPKIDNNNYDMLKHRRGPESTSTNAPVEIPLPLKINKNKNRVTTHERDPETSSPKVTPEMIMDLVNKHQQDLINQMTQMRQMAETMKTPETSSEATAEHSSAENPPKNKKQQKKQKKRGGRR